MPEATLTAPVATPTAPTAPSKASPAAPVPSHQGPPVTTKVSGPTRSLISEKLKQVANLRADGSPEPGTAPKGEAPKPQEKPPVKDSSTKETPKQEDPKKPEVPPADEIKQGLDEDPSKSAPSADDKKLGPWQLKAKWEKTAKALEAENAELRQKAAKLADLEQLQEKAKKYEERVKELEDHIRFVDYSKSEEFKTQYQQPYEEAWAKAVADLREINVTDAEGNSRPANASDLLRLANMPLGDAAKLANEMFGELSHEVMAHRRAVRELADKQQKALENAKKTAGEREQQQTSKQKEISEYHSKLWQEFNRQDEVERDFLKIKEGDDEWNEKVTGAKNFVDTAMARSAFDPNLSEEQRAKIIRDHVSIRGRAIGFSMVKLENVRLRKENESLKKTVSEFKKSEPTTGDGQSSTTPVVTASNRLDAIHAAIRARANR